ncbi:MAG: peptidoglycan DD-metalloendopeptidase family protein [Bacteroidales bacterium]|nr:peptidoglycan DD-metalloendopeptidase family protein [Bacteroidales bacterium]
MNNEKEKLQSIIEENNKLLEEYSSSKNSELLLISVVDDKILHRKRLINIYNNELFAYNNQINKLTFQLDSLENEINLIKSDYSKIIQQQYLNNFTMNSLAFVLSSSSFNESYRRLLFFKQYNDYRKSQVVLLKSNQQKFDSLKVVISKKQDNLKVLISNIETEKLALEQELIFRKANVDNISTKVSSIKTQIEQAQESMKSLENKILALIREESKKLKNSKVLSSDILKNKGVLPWPCASFVVVSPFGEHDHPLIPSIKVNNNGIDIDVLTNNEIKPIHSGVVSRIIMIPGSNASVIIRHGTILSVYSNLSEVFVKKDDNVTTSSVIGKVFTGEGLNSNILHFELWNGEEKQNPTDWLESF